MISCLFLAVPLALAGGEGSDSLEIKSKEDVIKYIEGMDSNSAVPTTPKDLDLGGEELEEICRSVAKKIENYLKQDP